MRALIIEDDQKGARLLAKSLREERFVVDTARSGEQAMKMASAPAYDVIVLDRLLPDTDGIVVCRSLREHGVVTPILMLSARGSLEDRVGGLNAGADDYLGKPFGFSELLARLRALLRRSDLTRAVVLKVGDLTLDPKSHRVARGGVTINLTRREYGILEVLMRHPGEIVGCAQLAERVWERQPHRFGTIIKVHICNLRRKIEPAGVPRLLHTIRGHGYRLGLPNTAPLHCMSALGCDARAGTQTKEAERGEAL
jgi:DNA-binding response OmpR family regulator